MGDAVDSPTTNGILETTNGLSEITNGGLCETKLLEERYEGDECKLTEKIGQATKTQNQYGKYALVSTQSFNKDNEPVKTTLEINSVQLLRALKEVVTYYPGHPLNFENPVKIESPFVVLYHHRQELTKYRASASSETVKTHIKLLLDYLNRGPSAGASELITHGLITFSLLWTIFKPGDLLLTFENGHKSLYWLEKVAYDKCYFQGQYLQLDCWYTASDGTQVGRTRKLFKIYQQSECPGTNALGIVSLSVFPLKHYPNPEAVKTELSERGKQYMKLQGVHIMSYQGLFMYLRLPPDSYFGDTQSFRGVWLPHTILATGRVVIDIKTFGEDNSAHNVRVYPWEYSGDKVIDGPQDTPMLCPPHVYGYSLEMRCWCQFFVDLFSAIQWNPDAFNALILPPPQKRIIKSLVGAHQFATQVRDEAALKGKGLVTLLHGTPGTGKTLTAEAVAEYTQKPLLIIPTGELGSQLDVIQTQIKRLIRYATTWKAVVLIDEADVFLEARHSGGVTSLERNGLVAVFLRQLEYFQGIIFLTSNRAQMFDPAAKSRIHLTLQYFAPNLSTRRQLWQQQLKLIPPRDIHLDIEKTLDVVTKYEMNGREISNSVNSAKTLARNELKNLGLEHLEVVLKVWADSKTLEEGEERGVREVEEESKDERLIKLVMSSSILSWIVLVLGVAALLRLLLGSLGI